jgi:hypothetical protein
MRGWGRPSWQPRALRRPLLCRRGWGRPPWRPRALHQPLLCRGGWGRPPWRPRARRQPLLHRRGWVMPPWHPMALRRPLLRMRGWGRPPWRPRVLRLWLQWRLKTIQRSGRGGDDDSRRQRIESTINKRREVEGQGGSREMTRRGTRNAHTNQTYHVDRG